MLSLRGTKVAYCSTKVASPWNRSCFRKKIVKSNFIGDARLVDVHDSQLSKSIELIDSHDRQPGNKVLLVAPKSIGSHGRQLTSDGRQFGSHCSHLKRTSR
jgi:hypothetical protein